MPTFRATSRLVALLLISEGAAGVAYGLWLVASLTLMSEMAGWFEVDAPLWAGAAGAQVAATVVLPCAAVATGGFQWWRMPEIFDRSRRRWLYGVLTVHVLVLAAGVLTPAWLAIAVGGMGVVAAASALAAGVAGGVDESKRPRAQLPWWRLAVASVATVVLVSAGAAVGAAVTGGDPEGPFDLATYPEDAVICRGPVTKACAQRVAARSGRPVAWVPSGDSADGGVFVVLARDLAPPLSEGRVIQELRDGWVHVSVYTHPAPPTFGGRKLVRQVTVGAVTADLYVEAGDVTSADLEWTHDGTAYRISAFRVSDDKDSVIESASRALARVRYTDP